MSFGGPARPTEAEILSIARRHLPRARSVSALFEQGLDHFAFEIDRRFIVKVGKPGTDPEYLPREALILERIAGQEEIRGPRFIASGEQSGRGYIVMERAAGAPLAAWPPDPTAGPAPEGPRREAILRELGATIAALHRLDLAPFAGHPTFARGDYASRAERKPARAEFDKEYRFRWDRGVAGIEANGWLSASEVRFLTACLADHLPQNPGPEIALLHNDIRPDHTFIAGSPPRLSAVIDFADAMFGPPALEFLFIWMRWWNNRSDVLLILDAYLKASGAGDAFQECVKSLRLVGAVARAGHENPEFREPPLIELHAFLDNGGRWSDELSR